MSVINKILRYKKTISVYPLEAVTYIASLSINELRNVINLIFEEDFIKKLLALLENNEYDFKFLLTAWIKDVHNEYIIPLVIIKKIKDATQLCRIDDILQRKIRIIINTLCTLISSKQIKCLISLNIIPIIMRGIFNNSSIYVKWYSIETLGNMMNNGNFIICNVIVNHDLLNNLMLLARSLHKINVTDDNDKKVIKRISFSMLFTLENLCRSKYKLSEPLGIKLISILEIISHFIVENHEYHLINTIYWLSKYKNIAFTSLLISSRLINMCIKNLRTNQEEIFKTSIQTINNICETSFYHTTIMFNTLNIGNIIKDLILHYHCSFESVKKQWIFWFLSNVAYGPQTYSFVYLMRLGLIKILLQHFYSDSIMVAETALYAISNVVTLDHTYVRKKYQVERVIKLDIIKHLYNFMKKANNNKQLQLILYTLDCIFKYGNFYRSSKYHYKNIFEKLGGTEHLILILQNKVSDFSSSYIKNQIQYFLIHWFDITIYI